MKKIFLAALLISGLLATAIPPWNTVNAINGETWTHDNNMMFIPSWVDPSGSFLDGTFNMDRRFDVGVKEICFFTYDEEKAAQAQVEEGIDNFRTAEWNRAMQCRELNPEYHSSIAISSSINDKFLLSNRSGVFYYAINLERWGAAGPDWIWGKIDHHYCSYDGSSDPHMQAACYWGGDIETNTFLLLRSGPAMTTEYIPWAEEWRQDLVARIGGFDAEIVAWEGDMEQKNSLVERLETAKCIAADASEGVELQEQFQKLLDKLEQKAITLAPVEPEKPPVTPEKPGVPELPKDDNPSSSNGTGNNRPSLGQVGGMAGSEGLGSNNNSEKNENLPDNGGIVISGPGRTESSISTDQTTNTELIASTIKLDEEKNDQRSESSLENDDSSLSGEVTEDELAIPALRDDDSGSWLGWLILGLACLSGLVVWWCKRAFWTTKRQKR